MLAALNHPNIAAIYAVEELDGGSALVMELVEGEDLEQRLARRALTIQDALPIALQIAEAIEAAHELGIVHRDLKPANIKVRDDGTVKVLDFGLAKALGPASAESATPAHPASSSDDGRERVILGTAAYMSPEQAQGKGADKRSDLWAFGVVLCEMLTGKPLYTGDTAAATLASVIEGDPPVSALPAAIPPAIRALIGRCLTKNPRERLQAIGEARITIARVIAKPGADPGTQSGPAIPGNRSRMVWQRAWPAALAVGLVAVGLVLWAERRLPPPVQPLRLTAELGGGATLDIGNGDALALSPDGRVAAFVARTATRATTQLYLRRLGALTEAQATALPGTDGAESPFFAPDGEQIAFFAGGKLKRIAVAGGAPVTVCEASTTGGGPAAGGAWSADGTIVFAPGRGPGVTLWRVSAAGGRAEPVASLARGEFNQRWPQVLPGGRGVLYTAPDRPGTVNDANLVVQPLPSGTPKIVHRGGYHARYLPSGHLVYLHDGVLFAVPFDLRRPADNRPGDLRAWRCGLERREWRGTVCDREQRHSRLPARAEPGWGEAGQFDRSGGQQHAAVGQCDELVQHSVLPRWPPARGGHVRGTRGGRLGLRPGPRQCDALDPPPIGRTEAGLDAGWPPRLRSTRTATTLCTTSTGNALTGAATPNA